MSNTTRIISVAHRKGGVGKTTVSILLATALATEGKKKVLYLDCDNQRSAVDYHAAEARNYGEEEPPYTIEYLAPRYLYDHLRLYAPNYDIVFVDMPRMTDDTQDSATVQLLTICDSLLLPIVAGQFDALSTNDFLKVVQEIAEYKNEKNIPFTYYGFLNRRNQRKDNERAVQFMQGIGLPMFKESLGDLKIFTTPSTYESMLSSAEGKKRFEAFYKEFLNLYKI